MLLHSSVFVTLSLPSPTNSSGRFGTVENRITNKEEDLKGTCLKELCPGPPRTKEQSKTLSHWRNWIVFSLFYSHQLYIKNNLMISVCLNRDFSHVCVSQRSSALWQLYFIIIYLFYIFSSQQLALYVSKPILVSHDNVNFYSWIIWFPYTSNFVKSHLSKGFLNQCGHVTMEGDLP